MDRKRVLIIEDIPENRVLLRAILGSELYEFQEAETGEIALKIIGEQTFDLILADIGLPHINGVEVTWQIRNQGIKTPIIIISAYLSKWENEDIFDCGANGIVAKPIEKDELLKAIQRVFEKNASSSEVS